MMLKRETTMRKRRIYGYDGKQQYKVNYYGPGSELWHA
jgi:hypothetical protein